MIAITLFKLNLLWEACSIESKRTVPSIGLWKGAGIPCFISLHLTALWRQWFFFFFLQIGGLWQPWVKQVYQHHFSSSICSVLVSLSHFGNFCSIPNILFLNGHGDLWLMVFDVTIAKRMTCWRLRWWLTFLTINYFKVKVCTLFFWP